MSRLVIGNSVLIRRRVRRPVKPADSFVECSIPSEHVEQRNFVRWFRLQYPGVRIFAIPNGEARSKTSGARLKAEGVSAGVPDLYIPAWKVWVEMKRTKGGNVSDKQADWHEYLRSIGDHVSVCHGCGEAVDEIKKIAVNYKKVFTDQNLSL